jgi:hypothetical protein
MKFTIILIFFSWFCSVSLFAQSKYSVKGAVADTTVSARLVNASVIVMNAKDSILRAYTRVKPDGFFTINNLSKGNYILRVSYPGYAIYVESFSLDSAHTSHDFGRLNLLLNERLLKDVIIKGTRAAIKIKGDTTEFDAKAYVVQPNAKVEDLLKQLPGLQVDKDGKITAQGQTVTKVLVDGEEFFGDDPTLVTKNIRADMVDKVQLYDNKSDQAAFTGIDDGVKTKTINIVLKEDKKNGTFGKLDVDLGTHGYYEAQELYNRFKAKAKFSAYATLANDGKTGLGFQDASQLGTVGGNVQFTDGGGISITSTGNDALDSFGGYYDGKGTPLVRSGGLHFDNKFNHDNSTLNLNYKIGSIEVTGNTATTAQQTLSTGLLNTNSNQTFDNYSFRQKIDGTYTLKLDTSANLKISGDATFKNFHVDNHYLTATDSSGILFNKSDRTVMNSGDSKIFNLSFLYTKKFKKVGRTLSWNVSEAYNDNDTHGYLNSEIDLYKNGILDSVQLTNQYKTTHIISSVLNSNITYSEPLSKHYSLLFNYGLGINNSSADRRSYNQSAPNVYNVLDPKYSNDYKFNQLLNQVGAILNYTNGKTIFNFGTKASDVNLTQVDQFTGIPFNRSFINLAPQAMYQYKFSQRQAITLNYNGSTTQPTIDQIQPVSVNTDPLNITIGNQGLKPSFTNRFNLSYSSYKVLTSQNFFMFGNFSNTYDAIVNNITESKGRNTIQYVNLANQTPYNYSLYTYIGRSVKPMDINVGLNVSTNGNISYSYADNSLSKAKNTTYSGSIQISKYVQKKYDFNASAGPSYTFSEMSLQPLGNQNAAGFNASGSTNLYLPGNIGTGTNVQYTYAAATRNFSAQYKTIWNVYVFRTFLKDDKLKVSLSVNDLLNENTNYTRGVSGNTITQTNTSSIRRFFMLSVVWDFTKFATLTDKK